MQNQNFIFRSFVCTAVLVVLSVLAVKSWGACDWAETVGTSKEFGHGGTCQSGESVCYQYAPPNFTSCYYGKKYAGNRFVESSCGGFYNDLDCRWQKFCCDNDCEADSVSNGGIILECQYDAVEQKWYRYTCHGGTNCSAGGCQKTYYNSDALCLDKYCEDNPTLPQCAPPDSVVVCENATQVEDGPIYTQMLLFKCVKSDNSSGFDSDRCRLMMNVPGTCGQNGYESGVQPSDSVAPDVDCFAAFDNTCYMMDKQTRNTFACGCDNNSCYLAKLAVASGDCRNPYASSSPSSSGSSSPSSASSASSSGSSSPSSSEGRPDENISSPAVESGSGGDWEYDYSGILNSINNNVIYVGNGVQAVNSSVQALNGSMERLNGTMGDVRANTQGIISNTEYTNTLINQKIVPAINSASSAITGKLDQFHGEWSGLWSDFTTSTSTDFDYSDTIDYYEPDYSDEIKDTSVLNLRDTIIAHKRSLDSTIAYVDSVRNDTTTNYVALDDIYDWSDTNQIKQKLSDFFIPNVSTLQSCPVIDYTIDWPSPIGSQRWYIPFGNLYGRFDLCEICRQLVKFLTLIIISLNSIKSIIRAFSSGGT